MQLCSPVPHRLPGDGPSATGWRTRRWSASSWRPGSSRSVPSGDIRAETPWQPHDVHFTTDEELADLSACLHRWHHLQTGGVLGLLLAQHLYQHHHPRTAREPVTHD